MNQIQRLLGAEHPFTGAVAGDGGAFRPVHYLRLRGFLRDEAGNGLSVLGDDDFLASPDTSQQTGGMVAQVSDCGGLHGATLM